MHNCNNEASENCVFCDKNTTCDVGIILLELGAFDLFGNINQEIMDDALYGFHAANEVFNILSEIGYNPFNLKQDPLDRLISRVDTSKIN